MGFIPESPVHLMSKGKFKQAALVLDKLGHGEEKFYQLRDRHTSSSDDDDDDPQASFSSALRSFSQLLTDISAFKPFATGVILMAFFQVTISKWAWD